MAFLPLPSRFCHPFPQCRFQQFKPILSSVATLHGFKIAASKRKEPSGRRLPKNLKYPRRAKAPPDTGIHRVPLQYEEVTGSDQLVGADDEIDGEIDTEDESVWAPDEIEAITSLFERGAPKKLTKPRMERPLPLPTTYRNNLPRVPTPKHHIRSVARAALASRLPLSNRVYKNPDVLIGIAREISALPSNVDASVVLEKWSRLLRKGSLSMTIRELGHMGLPDRALQVLCWAQGCRPMFFPDDRILASTVEILARNGRLKMQDQLDKYLHSASRSVMEAMARGFIRAGNLNLARKVLLYAKDNNRTLDPSIHAKLILEAGKNPDKYRLVEALLDELGQREDLDLKPQDCTAVMKICIRMGKFEAVESLFNWYKASGRTPTVVMYTTVIHGRYSSKKYREGLAAIWEMEDSNILLDLPAYRVVIRLCVALDDLARAARYFSRLKEAGFTPTYDIYRDMIHAYASSGRLAKCRQVCKEAEVMGIKLDDGILSMMDRTNSVK